MTPPVPRWYRAVLRLYPRAFRRRFGEGMAGMYADEAREARSRGMLARLRLLGRTAIDLSVSVPAAHLTRSWRHDPATPHETSAAFMDTFRRDLRLALRSLARHPMFGLIALVTLALGIGANSAIFSVVNGVLLRPLAYPDPGRLVTVWTAFLSDNRPQFPLSTAEYLDYRAATRAMSEVGLYGSDGVTVTGSGPAERRIAAWTTRSAFRGAGRAGRDRPDVLGRGRSDRGA